MPRRVLPGQNVPTFAGKPVASLLGRKVASSQRSPLIVTALPIRAVPDGGLRSLCRDSLMRLVVPLPSLRRKSGPPVGIPLPHAAGGDFEVGVGHPNGFPVFRSKNFG